MRPEWRRRFDTEALLRDSEQVRVALVATAERLDQFVAELRAEIDRPHQEDPDAEEGP